MTKSTNHAFPFTLPDAALWVRGTWPVLKHVKGYIRLKRLGTPVLEDKICTYFICIVSWEVKASVTFMSV